VVSAEQTHSRYVRLRKFAKELTAMTLGNYIRHWVTQYPHLARRSDAQQWGIY
jgi:hypothetical protein